MGDGVFWRKVSDGSKGAQPIMVHLKNIVRNDKEISADYYPEDRDKKGFRCVNLRSGEIVRYQGTSYDKPLGTYAEHAALTLRRLISRAELPAELIDMWY